MEPLTVEEQTAIVFEQLAEALGAKGKTLKKRLAFANRQLPGRVRRAGQVLVEAQVMAESPRMAMQIDVDAFEEAFKIVNMHLAEIDSAAERSRKRYNRFAAIAAQVLFVAAAIVAVLVWRGYL